MNETESQKARETFSKLCHDVGLLDFRIEQLQGDRADILIKIRNAALDYERAKKIETREHLQEVPAGAADNLSDHPV